ncbi:MAG TPA: glycosyltransferase family 8 protein [Cyclobacteriaceae bacterium]|jgi:lipopolysaccharide biosynthesis glycosyltransferase|nr:glycosyltransferase family 8 protein [Cyclobacteriaceae bacterium]
MIHLAIAFDENYRQQFYALLSSVLNHSKNQKLSFHLIAPSITKAEQEKIENYIVSQLAHAIFYPIEENTLSQLALRGNWTHAVYYRLLFPLLVSPEVERLLYLDSDTIVVNDLSNLYNADLGIFPVGAVYDIYVKEQQLIGIPLGDYFNSGVLLIDIKKWKDQDISNRALTYLRNFPENILYVDQCGLNAVLKGNWKKMDYGFNVLYSYLPTESGLRELKQFISGKTIIHFTLQRPWNFLCKNRLRFLYKKFLFSSPLAGRPIRVYDDFRIAKIPEWFKIRVTEIYADFSFLQGFWKTLKKIF